jgi:hypothetical protein
LDIRNKQLVKIAENVLKKEEDRLFGILGAEEVKITQIAENKPKYLSSFSQIYRILFMLIIAICIAIGGWSIDEHYERQQTPLPAEDRKQNS